jgi:hypothetical protein
MVAHTSGRTVLAVGVRDKGLRGSRPGGWLPTRRNLGSRPVGRRGFYRPELRRRTRELKPNRRQARVRRPKKSNRGFAFVRGFHFIEDDLLSQLHLGTQDDERTVSADRQRERFFAEGLLVRGLAANNERHIKKHALATSLRVGCQWPSLFEDRDNFSLDQGDYNPPRTGAARSRVVNHRWTEAVRRRPPVMGTAAPSYNLGS